MWIERVLFTGCFLINLWILVKSECEVNLQQKRGIVQGYGLEQTTPKGDPFCSFMGIPYAQPPVGDLRFELPQPIDLSRIASSFDFRAQSPVCVQNQVFTNNTGQEDCLYLNVYTKPQSTEHLKPVLVWIHGGFSHFGSAYSEGADRVDYLVDEDVVVVTFNYRLGILGFMYRHNDNFIGNLGLRDQLEAFKWVKANIASFGGNPRKVTLMGWSAGGTHIGYYIQAPLFRGLFQSAIMLSGSPLSPWAYERTPDSCSNVLCKVLNVPCSRGNLKNILRGIPAETFGSRNLNRIVSISYLGERHVCFGPIFEGNDVTPANAIVQDEQIRLLSKPIVNDVPLLISYTVSEDWFYYVVNENTLARPWNYSFINTREDVIRQLRRYLIAGTKELNNRSARFMVPASFVHGITQFARYYESNAFSNVYMYRYSHKNISNIAGSFHGDDLQFIFGPLDIPKTSADHRVRMRLVQYLTNFAKFGNPTPTLDNVITTNWVPYTNTGLRMEISDESRVVRDVKDEIYRQWDIILQCIEFNQCKKFFKLTSDW